MIRNIALKIIMIALLPYLCSCASTTVTERNVKMELAKVKRMIQTNSDKIVKLKDKKINDRGFFYVIDNTGLVVYHPQELLIGRNFSDYWFIQVILKTRSGCLSYTIGTQEHFIFFDNLQKNQILCYSIAAADMEGPVEHCARVTPEDTQVGQRDAAGSDSAPEAEVRQGTGDDGSDN